MTTTFLLATMASQHMASVAHGLHPLLIGVWVGVLVFACVLVLVFLGWRK